MAIQYSDGIDIEAKILDIVKATDDLRSTSLIGKEYYQHWPVFYHLSPLRANLVRHLNFSELDVLELGSGMGGVSRHVAENCRHLTVVEGTQARFNVLSSRLRDLKNWEGRVANLQDVTFTKKFDVVCFFGVLEYSEHYINADQFHSAHEKAILSALGHLKEDGVLIVAIENRLGAKYLAGADEDHLSRPYLGICGYAATKTARTFSRPEMERMLRKCGLIAQHFEYPWPDYKIPSSIINDQMFEQYPQTGIDIACAEKFRSYGKDRPSRFPESLFLASLAGDYRLGDFSNSFLISASRDANSATLKRLLPPADFLGVNYSSWWRKTPVETRFTNTSEGLRVEKKPTAPIAAYQFVRSRMNSTTSALRGEYRKASLLRHAQNSQTPDFLRDLISFHEFAFREFSMPGSPFLQGIALDALVTNAVVVDAGKTAFFDLEWDYIPPLTKQFHIFRNICALARIPGIMEAQLGFGSLNEVYDRLVEHFALENHWEENLAREVELQCDVTKGQNSAALAPGYRALLSASFGACAAPQPPGRKSLPRRFLGKVKKWTRKKFS